MKYYFLRNNQIHYADQPPASSRPLLGNSHLLLPPLVSQLHQNLYAWGVAGYSPGPIVARRVRFNEDGLLIFSAERERSTYRQPLPLQNIGQAPDLAAWFVLLDKWMDTFVVIARARTIWTAEQLAGALTFTTPAFLPNELVAQPPDNWARVAQTLARAIADKHMTGTPATQVSSQEHHRGQPQTQIDQDQHAQDQKSGRTA